MSTKPDKRIQAEYDRIARGPRTGWFTLLHHEGPELEQSHDVIERLASILAGKPEHERLVRLTNIVWVSDAKADDYNAKRKLLDDDYYAKRKLLIDDYYAKRKLLDDDYYAKRKLLVDDYYAKRKLLVKKLNPRTTWNGKTIFS